MLQGLYSAASAMGTQAERQDIIARNLAHVNVPGFKRMLLGLEAKQAGRPDRMSPSGSQQTDFSQGIMEQTGRKLDVAISGDGFFVFEGPRGDVYSRNGVLNRNDAGELVNASGYLLKDSPRLPPTVAENDITITPQGQMFANGQALGKIDIVTFADKSALKPVGTTLFEAPPGTNPAEAEGTIQQGMRERSNVSSVVEMVQMLAGMRHHEASARSMQMLFEAIQRHMTAGS